LHVTVPFHSKYLASVPGLVEEDIKRFDLHFDVKSLHIPVYGTHSGKDLRGLQGGLSRIMVDMICTFTVQWDVATPTTDFSHVIDFGPGGYSGIGGLVAKNKEGSGCQVILASTLASSASQDVFPKWRLFDTLQPLTYAPNWAELYRPKLVEISSTGEIHIDTRFSRLLGTL
jgi:fatty acid synthase subunit alpha, fungi type